MMLLKLWRILKVHNRTSIYCSNLLYSIEVLLYISSGSLILSMPKSAACTKFLWSMLHDSMSGRNKHTFFKTIHILPLKWENEAKYLHAHQYNYNQSLVQALFLIILISINKFWLHIVLSWIILGHQFTIVVTRQITIEI